MKRIGLKYKDGSDLDYVASYDVPDEVPLRVIAQLSVVYNHQMGEDDELRPNPAWMFNFEEWVLETTGVIIVPVEEGELYDAFTGEPWY